ncbi:hypothetical protein C8034_v010856 [Colletotrichum sidae]|uniref:Azaphilone pigments biosynthesis cluster protein L N-terminal domain-containing protein n=1 Tax=Colletotrichum sidae TaxID=1347389 RepID=A0A4R8TL13_9PEZI|nr:hypothetical protein C8034_v010856 [Colletotrichum sidae]
MADPLSIAASVAGLITLAASTAKLAKSMSDRYTEQVAASVRQNVNTLDVALFRVRDGLSTQHFSRAGEQNLRQPVELCAGTLRELEIQFQRLEGKGSSWNGVMRRLARPEVLKEIERLQRLLEGQKTTLLVAMQNCSGESQAKMLDMIFRAVEELRTTLETKQVTGTPVSGSVDGFSASATASTDDSTAPSMVHAYPTFEDWLENWTVPIEEPNGVLKPPSDETPQEQFVSTDPIVPDEPRDITLIVDGLYQRESRTRRKVKVEVHATTETPVYDIIFQLEEKGRRPLVIEISD